MIQFFCPNGHKIRCSDDRIGMAAKCPKCGVKFRVPSPDDQEESGDISSGGSAISMGPEGETDEPSHPAGVALGAATAERQIEFLCPNNHLLHGPAELQGEPGECPQCGSRFRIPSYEDVEEEASGSESALPTVGDRHVVTSPPDGLTGLEVVPGSGLTKEQTAYGASNDGGRGGVGSSVPFAQLFAVLWGASSGDATLELHYGDNQQLCPSRFLHSLSLGTHAVFAVEEPNGTWTLTAIAWNAISSVVIRGLTRLPG